MDDRTPKAKLNVANPARYRIQAQGSLDKRWSGRLGGLEITVFSPEDNYAVTQLCGEVMDQAALMGVLNSLYDLHMPLISVELLAEASGSTIPQ